MQSDSDVNSVSIHLLFFMLHHEPNCDHIFSLSKQIKSEFSTKKRFSKLHNVFG